VIDVEEGLVDKGADRLGVKVNGDLAADAPKENAGVEPEPSGLLPNEKPDVVLDEPKENVGAAAGLLDDEPNGNVGAAGAAVVLIGPCSCPRLKVEDSPLPKLNENGLVTALDAGVVGLAFAPPKDNCGVEPPGPNLPNFATGGDDAGASIEEEGAKALLSGVAGCSGPEGAKEKSGAGFFPSRIDCPTSALRFGVETVVSSLLPEMTSSTSLVTSADGLLGEALGASAGFAGTRKVNGDFGAEELATVGTKPGRLEALDDEDAEASKAKLPTFGSAGGAAEDAVFRAVAAGTLPLITLFASPLNICGMKPDFFFASSR
jgi:hypothetical protein